VSKRIAYIILGSEERKRYICVDALENEKIMKFINDKEARKKKFRYIIDLILQNIKNPDLYDKEDITDSINDVYAMKLFKGGENIRIYCKQVSRSDGTFYVIASELLEKKKSEKNNAKSKSLIIKVHNYEYEIQKYPGEE